MYSRNTSSLLPKNTPKLLFFLMTVFIGLPVFFFFYFAVKGFLIQFSDKKPENVVVEAITKSTARVVWTTQASSQGVVEYGTLQGKLDMNTPEIKPKKEHEVDLTLLSPATTYYYRLRIDDQIFDNSGVPWTFTTKTKDGKDVAAVVKGISTRKLGDEKEASPTAVLGTAACIYTTCQEIQQHLGAGCGAADYLKCLSSQAGGTPGVGLATSTPVPVPTTILIVSNLCKVEYLQVGEDCTKWSWDSFDTKPQTCRGAFDRYVFQCRSKSFSSTNEQDFPIWYYNNALTHTSSSSATLKVIPASGSMVYCQVRAEDAVGGNGHSTPWVRAETKCK